MRENWVPLNLDAQEQQRLNEARHVIPPGRLRGWVILYGWYDRVFRAFGAPDGRPIEAATAKGLLEQVLAAEMHYQTGPPARPYA